MYDRLTSLAKDPSRARRAELLMRVTDLMASSGGALSDDMTNAYSALVLQVLPTVGDPERVEIANRLADIAHAPSRLIRSLAAVEIDIAAPLLRRSVVLDDDDLMALIATKTNDHLMAIAARIRISEKLSDALLAHGNRQVVKALAQNHGARFSAKGLARLVDEASAIARHESRGVVLPFDRTLAARHPPRVAAAGPATIVAFPGAAASIPDPFKPAIEAGAESPIAAVIATLASGDRMLEVATLLAEAAGLPTDRVSRLIARADPTPLMVFCKAAGVDTGTFAMIVAVHGRCFGRGSNEVFQLVKRYAVLDVGHARRALRFLTLDETASSADEWLPSA